MASPVSRVKKLFEITNTPRAKKIAVEEPESCVQIADEEIIDLNLGASDSDDLFADIELDVDGLVFGS